MQKYTVIIYHGVMTAVEDREINSIGWGKYFTRQREAAEAYCKGKKVQSFNIQEVGPKSN